jgi:hypothetical protein
MATVPISSQKSEFSLKKKIGVLEILGEYMKISYEEEDNDEQEDIGESAYEEEDLTSETDLVDRDPGSFVDNVQVLESTKRPTIFLKYNANINFGESYIVDVEEETEEEDEVPPEQSFDPEEIVEIAEGSLGTGSPFASQVANAAIAEIIRGPIADTIRPYEVTRPWQTVGPQYVGNPFLTEDTFYMYAEVETPDTSEDFFDVSDFIGLDEAESYVELVNQNNQDSNSLTSVGLAIDLQLKEVANGLDNNLVSVEKIDAVSATQIATVMSLGNMASYF